MLRTTAKTAQPTTLDFLSYGMDMTVQHEEKSYQIKQSQLSKTWRTAALLQTTLDIKEMLNLFSHEINETVPHSGIQYSHTESLTNISVGRSTKQKCKFQLLVEKQQLGEITFSSGKPFTQKQSAQLEFLLASLVYPLRNALQYLSSFQASVTDTLTGKNNRFIMSTCLKHEIASYRRYKTPFTMLIVDVDALKDINESHGRKAGDKTIKATADIISECLRDSDTLIRYAGDEFVIILSNTTLSGAHNIAEHIRDVIENTQIINKGKIINFTVSVGGACISSRDNGNSLLAKSYEALRHSKRDGRNCTTLPGYHLE